MVLGWYLYRMRNRSINILFMKEIDLLETIPVKTKIK